MSKETIHEDREFHSSTELEVFPTWKSMKLKEDLLARIAANKWEAPSPIQSRAIVPIASGLSIIMQSQNGTGKTATFSIGVLQRIRANSAAPELIVISPIRELAIQTESTLTSLGATAHACIGGNSFGDDVKALRKGCNCLSGTPGRVLQLIKEHSVDQSKVKAIVLDEADEMLTSFKRTIMDILTIVKPYSPQIVVVTATVSEDVIELETAFMQKCVKLFVPRDELTLSGVQQFFVQVKAEEWKFDALCDLYQSVAIERAVIFVNTREKGEWLKEKMISSGFTVALAHGQLEMNERTAITDEFRNGDTRVLIATDVWARGIDVRNVTLVINFDIPTQCETYLHRIGRSGRFGRKGIAITLSSGEGDEKKLKKIMKFYSSEIKPLPSDLDSLFF